MTFEQVLEDAPSWIDENAARIYWDNEAGYWEDEDAKTFWDSYEEAFQGIYDDESDFTRQLADDCGIVPSDEMARRYFDYDALERDLFMGDYWSADIPGGVVVFRSL